MSDRLTWIARAILLIGANVVALAKIAGFDNNYFPRRIRIATVN